MSKHHRVKCWTQYFDKVLSGEKTFEVRIEDGRNYEQGDTITQCDYNPTKKTFSGREVTHVIGYVLEMQKYLPDTTLNYKVFSLLPPKETL